jgi:hypothetical protein
MLETNPGINPSAISGREVFHRGPGFGRNSMGTEEQLLADLPAALAEGLPNPPPPRGQKGRVKWEA